MEAVVMGGTSSIVAAEAVTVPEANTAAKQAEAKIRVIFFINLFLISFFRFYVESYAN